MEVRIIIHHYHDTPADQERKSEHNVAFVSSRIHADGINLARGLVDLRRGRIQQIPPSDTGTFNSYAANPVVKSWH